MDTCATRNPLGCQGSACVEIMTTLHGNAPSLQRRAEGCVPSEGMIASARDPLKSTPLIFRATLTSVGGRLIRVSDQSNQRSNQRGMDSQIVTVNQFAEAMTSIQEAIASLGWRIDGQQAQQTEVAPPLVTMPTPTSEDPHARMDRLEQRLRQLRTSDKAVTWEDFDGAPVANLPAKFRMQRLSDTRGLAAPASI
ncbi:hypothetical protein CK203_066277 [Vitis vinifera]|uniref:Uncharacterized protein n=1 Tax=Vitis vinifera TaxID=29760 RepID=A0A438G2A7_VITVI|nr:hypothetical protein CK203_066277 [Vitis vinifera]